MKHNIVRDSSTGGPRFLSLRWSFEWDDAPAARRLVKALIPKAFVDETMPWVPRSRAQLRVAAGMGIGLLAPQGPWPLDITPPGGGNKSPLVRR